MMCPSSKYLLKILEIQNKTGQLAKPCRNSGSYPCLIFRGPTSPTYLMARIHREEGIIILAGGLSVHNLINRKHFAEHLASPNVKMFDRAITVAASQPEVTYICAYSSP